MQLESMMPAYRIHDTFSVYQTRSIPWSVCRRPESLQVHVFAGATASDVGFHWLLHRVCTRSTSGGNAVQICCQGLQGMWTQCRLTSLVIIIVIIIIMDGWCVCVSIIPSGAFCATRTRPLIRLLASMCHDCVIPVPSVTTPTPLISYWRKRQFL